MTFDMATIAEAVTSLKTASDIAKTLINLKDSASIQPKISELYDTILSAQRSALAAQSSQFSLLETARGLEKKIADFETWDHERLRYELRDVNPSRGSVFVYALKEEAVGAEPFHLICPKCYQNRRKSILQATSELRMRLRVHECPECKAEFAFAHVPLPERPTQANTRYNPFDRGSMG